MALTEGLLTMFEADAAEAVARRRDDTQLAIARQRDATQLDNRVFQGFLARQLFQSDDAEMFASLNTGARIPTTLDHPSIPVGNPANTTPPR